MNDKKNLKSLHNLQQLRMQFYSRQLVFCRHELINWDKVYCHLSPWKKCSALSLFLLQSGANHNQLDLTVSEKKRFQFGCNDLDTL